MVEATTAGGEIDKAFADAEITIADRFRVQRLAGSPIETRAATAVHNVSVDHHDVSMDEIVLWSSTQTPHLARTVICEVCGWPEHRLRVIAPDVGGGFGPKDHAYIEDVVVCAWQHIIGGR